MLLMLLALGSTGPRHHRGVGYDGRWYISRLGGNQRQGHSSRLRDLNPGAAYRASGKCRRIRWPSRRSGAVAKDYGRSQGGGKRICIPT